jgi:hypothetical protein
VHILPCSSKLGSRVCLGGVHISLKLGGSRTGPSSKSVAHGTETVARASRGLADAESAKDRYDERLEDRGVGVVVVVEVFVGSFDEAGLAVFEAVGFFADVGDGLDADGSSA